LLGWFEGFPLVGPLGCVDRARVLLPLRCGLPAAGRLLRGRLTCGAGWDAGLCRPPDLPAGAPAELWELLVWVAEVVSDDEELELVVDDVPVVPATPVVELLVLVVETGSPPSGVVPGGLDGGTMRGSAESAVPESGPPTPLAVSPPPASTEISARQSHRRLPAPAALPESSLIASSSTVSRLSTTHHSRRQRRSGAVAHETRGA
jgi:hypothetical protein